MAIGSRFSKLAFAVLLALPAAGGAQTPDLSRATLEDTLSWLRNFLPTATGSAASVPNRRNHKKHATITSTTTLKTLNGCKISLTTDGNWALPGGSTMQEADTAEFSLADITPASIKVIDRFPDGRTGQIVVSLSSETKSIKFFHTVASGGGEVLQESAMGFGNFHDRAAAELVASALQHAAQLCANSQPF